MIAQFVSVWTELVSWITTLFSSITELFVTTTIVEGAAVYSLTFVGTCAVIMAGIALMLLVFNLIRSFVNMRG